MFSLERCYHFLLSCLLDRNKMLLFCLKSWAHGFLKILCYYFLGYLVTQNILFYCILCEACFTPQ